VARRASRRATHRLTDTLEAELEIAKDISLAELDPAALIALQRSGSCEFCLTEALFDREHPGHYLRRISSVGLSVLGVAGPYAGAQVVLTLVKSAVRSRPDGRLVETAHDARVEAAAGDELVAPFEGAGAISDWQLELPASDGFDLGTITDVIVRLVYTAC
jgi:hypothetical protein